ncbi:protein downstream neighbor of son homolog [Pollicipes pollicipes]|uniref:protein downstream neighbor of son homolog n=1 Tax=Pollicipes pollicipes TaxID=41117 RepID=UPI001884D561|nr:protein downstream neighbor of son homolog [Pollicipes pollicipes]
MQFQVEEAPKGERNLPTDWGLKTKIRFLSKTPFPWTSRLKTLEEASAVTSCVRCLPADQSTLDTSPNAQLQRHALYWQHPWLPWLTLFPRLHSRVAGARSLFIDAPMQDLLRTEWGESLRSLFQLLRSRQCPFFYVCAASFCCLFRAAGVGGVTDTHAIVTPTTRGLRDLLKRDDVQFTLPLRPAAAPAQSAAQEDGSEDEDEDPEHWLESKGIAADAMPGMHSTRRKLQEETRRGLDGQPASTVLVQGGDVYALLNFLLNSRACVTASGPLAGVPPTLLAPVGFQGASLQPLKVRHGTVQQARETFHSFELAGPVMPHAVQALVALVRRSHAHFSLSLSGVRAVFGQQGLTDCGLDGPLVATLCEPAPAAAAAVLREVTCTDGLFTW